MRTPARFTLSILIIVLAVVLLPRQREAMPCNYAWRYVISYASTMALAALPDDAYPKFPPLCLDVVPVGYHAL